MGMGTNRKEMGKWEVEKQEWDNGMRMRMGKMGMGEWKLEWRDGNRMGMK